MRFSTARVVLLALLAITLFASAAQARGTSHQHPSCHMTCREHRAHWRTHHVWEYRWNHKRPWERAWLRLTASCESGGKATAVSANGKYRGLTQFDADTAQKAGFTKPPDQVPYFEQADRSIDWMRRNGFAPWPRCGVRAAGILGLHPG